MDPINITKESVARQLVDKHEKVLKTIREEFVRYSTLEQELDKAAENNKTERDKLNIQVQELKEKRQNYYSESRELRREFMTQLKKKKSMADIPMEVLILTKQIDQFEWEIQTEAVNIDDEKKLVKRIQENLDRMHEYANKYQEHEEVSNAVKKLTSKLNKKVRLTQKMHEDMINSVNVSDEHHKKFVEVVIKLRDARAKRVGFQHDLEKHKNAIEHWMKIAEKEAKANKTPKQKLPRDEKKDIDKPTKKIEPKTTPKKSKPVKLELEKNSNDKEEKQNNDVANKEPVKTGGATNDQ